MSQPIPSPEIPSPIENGLWQTLARKPLTFVFMGLAILLVDLFTGPYLMFPIFFVLPITLAAWYHGWRLSGSLSLLLPIGRVFIALYVDKRIPGTFVFLNGVIRILVLGFIALLVSRTARQTRELSRELKLLQGILPICMFCKRIRDEQKEWQQLESYICAHSEADFSHGLCPECAQKHYGDVLALSKRK